MLRYNSHTMKNAILSLVFVLASSVLYAEKLTTIDAKVSSMKKYSGFFTFYWDEQTGKIFLEIDKWEKEFIYINSLPAGVGSNDIGLDRGQIGENRIVYFWRSGPRVLLIQPNYSYRANTSDRAEKTRGR